jgi:hypothetical protein
MAASRASRARRQLVLSGEGPERGLITGLDFRMTSVSCPRTFIVRAGSARSLPFDGNESTGRVRALVRRRRQLLSSLDSFEASASLLCSACSSLASPSSGLLDISCEAIINIAPSNKWEFSKCSFRLGFRPGGQ